MSPRNSASRRPTTSAPTGGHLPPQALDIEAAVLGAALLEAEAQRTLLVTLPTEEIFYSTAHQQVYLAIRDLVTRGDHAGQLTVVQQLRYRGTLERTGGPHFVATIEKYDYDRQAALYLDVLGATRFLIIGVQKKVPHSVWRVELTATPGLIEQGRKKYCTLLRHSAQGVARRN